MIGHVARGPTEIRINGVQASRTLKTPHWGAFRISRITSEAGTKLTHLRLKANEVALINESDLQGRTHEQPAADIKSSGASDQETDIKKDF